ncbi:MAG: carboxypeptidase regulatory-like domain-containing protein, partial [Methylomicrobium sp.]|nr:carboxypeptidase regulatory-like domain-containing protein [Methylomicrobium sp.]
QVGGAIQTDASGNYSFTGLMPGDYVVQFIAPNGTVLSTANIGGNDLVDSDAGLNGFTGCYSLAAGETNTSVDAGLVQLAPGIDIEKTTNGSTNTNPTAPNYDNEDTSDGSGVPILTAGSSVTWTYKVTNTGNTDFAQNEISIVDDNGTTSNTADDMTIANGKIVYQSGDANNDKVLNAGESWLYKANGIVQQLSGDLGTATTFTFAGNTSTDGTDGNTRTYTAGGISVEANAWSRDKGTDTWQKAWLGSYGGGLGVTDSSEGSGWDTTHTVDNNGRDNYIVFKFSQNVVIDKAYLGYVSGDSDLSVYIGSTNSAITSMNNAVLSGMTKEFNDTDLTGARWADFNSGNTQGNVLIIAARDDGHSMDYFKLEKLVAQAVQDGGIYVNKATVTAGGVSDFDLSHYKTAPAPVLQKIGDYVWEDKNFNGIQDGDEKGISGVTVNLLSTAGTVLQTTTTDASGKYGFDVSAGNYQIKVVTPNGYFVTKQDKGSNNGIDSDINSSGMTNVFSVTAGQDDLSIDAGLYRKASIGDRVWFDSNGNGIQDTGEGGVANVKLDLFNDGVYVATATTDANGHYLFSHLNPGQYHIDVQESTLPQGFIFTTANVGSNDNIDSDVRATSSQPLSWGIMDSTFLESGEVDRSWDVGIVKKMGSLGNYVWEDKNFNGIQESGEKGISGVSVQLYNSSHVHVGTTTTNSSGEYNFGNLNEGWYYVRVLRPSGYLATKQNVGTNDHIDSDINSNGYSDWAYVTTGQHNASVDAGLYRKASIGDRVWEDSDHDGIQDTGEIGIGGIRVSLLNSNGSVIANTTTNSTGNYLFSNLDPGVYSLRFDKADVWHYSYWNAWYNMNDWKWGAKDVGSNDLIDSDVNNSFSTTRYAFTAQTFLESGENDRSWDAAITPIVIDLNGDGIKTISRADSQGTFDLFGNGQGIHSGWISGDDGFLAIDRNGNGVIEDITELFGGLSQGEGFAKLAEFDSNGDGWVDANDDNFASLLIWQDKNGNHQSDEGELLSLSDAGIASLSVNFTELPFVDAQGNLHFERSTAVLDNGQSVDMTDVYFNVSLEDAADAGVQLSTMFDLLGDTVQAEVVDAGYVYVPEAADAEPVFYANYEEASAALAVDPLWLAA